MEEIREAMRSVEGITPEQISETERRLLDMAQEQPRIGAADLFSQAMVEDGGPPDRLSAAERARLRKQRKRERQGRRKGRRSR